MTDLKVVPLHQAQFSDPIAALKEIVKQLESGERSPCVTGVFVMMGADGGVETFGFGPKSEDLHCIGLMQLGQQVIMDSALGLM
jgi:hypothetical protein